MLPRANPHGTAGVDIGTTDFNCKKRQNLKDMDRYQEAPAASKVTENDAEVAAEVKKIVDEAGKYASPEV